ncbi:MAG: DNA polymerase III subunit gamma/tau [Patescibacteria group bacterium]|nr:DNA polymerase III subunit gamma/tau [Patescibacteria group bacterium]
MSDLVLYRKYRPKKFSEVLGQDHITKTLKEAIKLGNISHAYLFSGTRGTGKTSVARILAQEIKCSINDLSEIDAASNRGIDAIRELREAVNVLPFESPYKVYIIDEVHMLTKDAFNALLKTLEEPPKHVVFVLATTESDKIPDTIVSRCQTFTFKKPSQKTLNEIVLDVTKKEKFILEKGTEELIALLGDGSFRDTLGILQKVISASSDKKISLKEVEKITGAPNNVLVNDFISSLDEKKLNNGLKVLNQVVENGIDIQIFLKLILHKIRAVLLLRFAKDMEKKIEDSFSEKDFKFLKEISQDKDSNIKAEVIKELIETSAQIKLSYIQQLPLELMLIKLAK